MTSYRADYCHSSSGNGDSTGDRPLPDVQHMIESAVVGWEGVGGCSACWSGLFWGQPANSDAFLITVRDSEGALAFGACRPPDHAAGVPDFCQPRNQKVVGMIFFFECTCQRDGDRAGSKVAVFLPLPLLFEY